MEGACREKRVACCLDCCLFVLGDFDFGVDFFGGRLAVVGRLGDFVVEGVNFAGDVDGGVAHDGENGGVPCVCCRFN